MPVKKDKLQTPRPRATSARAKTPHWTAEQRQQIAELAYYQFLSRGGHNGSQLDDWLKAESEFAAKLKPAKRAKPVLVGA